MPFSGSLFSFCRYMFGMLGAFHFLFQMIWKYGSVWMCANLCRWLQFMVQLWEEHKHVWMQRIITLFKPFACVQIKLLLANSFICKIEKKRVYLLLKSVIVVVVCRLPSSVVSQKLNDSQPLIVMQANVDGFANFL